MLQNGIKLRFPPFQDLLFKTLQTHHEVTERDLITTLDHLYKLGEIDVNRCTPDTFAWTPLHIALQRKFYSLARWFVVEGDADVNAIAGEDDMMPLSIVASHVDLNVTGSEEMRAFLEERGAKTTWRSPDIISELEDDGFGISLSTD